MAASAHEIIAKLGLQPHPEGGWCRETWRAEAADGARGAPTSILFLLEAGQRARWRRIDAAELWLFQAGGALRLLTAADGAVAERRLGPDILGGDLAQARIEPYQWRAAEALGHEVSAACVVVPAFEFVRLELAPSGWDPRDAML